MITQTALASIKVLFCRDDSLCLYGIPYQMRPGQSPAHLWRSEFRGARDGWIYLGSPGWFGSMSKPEIALVKEYLGRVHALRLIPGGPMEWTDLVREGFTPRRADQCLACSRIASPECAAYCTPVAHAGKDTP